MFHYNPYGRGTVDIPPGPIVRPVPRPGPQPFPVPDDTPAPTPEPKSYRMRRRGRMGPPPGGLRPGGYRPRFRRNYGVEHVTEMGIDANQIEADVMAAADAAGDLAMDAGAEVAAVVEESRKHAEHRKFLYMVGAPVIVYAGLTNKSNKTIGMLSALVGAYIGIKNYQDEQAEKARSTNLGRFF